MRSDKLWPSIPAYDQGTHAGFEGAVSFFPPIGGDELELIPTGFSAICFLISQRPVSLSHQSCVF
jgi:hypothetical protein